MTGSFAAARAPLLLVLLPIRRDQKLQEAPGEKSTKDLGNITSGVQR